MSIPTNSLMRRPEAYSISRHARSRRPNALETSGCSNRTAMSDDCNTDGRYFSRFGVVTVLAGLFSTISSRMRKRKNVRSVER